MSRVCLTGGGRVQCMDRRGVTTCVVACTVQMRTAVACEGECSPWMECVCRPLE